MATLYLLGTGTPTPTQSRFGTSYVLQLDKEYLMFDCGPATTSKLVKAGLWPTQIDYLFFTHHHFDHNVDYPCFLLCRWDQSTGKQRTLQVFGPPPTKLITDRLIGPQGAFVDDWKARVGAPLSQHVHQNRGGSLPRPEPVVELTELASGNVAEGKGWKVTAAAAHHVEPWMKSLAYRLEAKNLVITFASDTGPCKSVTELAKGTDVLVVNCWDHQQTMLDNGEAPGQTGTLDAANMALESGAKTLILAHTGKNVADPGSKEKAIADIARTYKGKTIFAEELMRIDLTN